MRLRVADARALLFGIIWKGVVRVHFKESMVWNLPVQHFGPITFIVSDVTTKVIDQIAQPTEFKVTSDLQSIVGGCIIITIVMHRSCVLRALISSLHDVQGRIQDFI